MKTLNSRFLVFSSLLLLSCGLVNAQGFALPKSTAEGNTQVVKINLQSLMRNCPTVSYERSLMGNTSAEVGLGVFGKGGNEHNYLHGYLIKVGYKFNFATGATQKALRQQGLLSHGFYLKPELCYVHRSREYVCYVGNEGWNIHTTRENYADNALALMLVGGYQLSFKHFYIEAYLSWGRYWSGNVFDQAWYYGFTGWGGSQGGCTNMAWKLGIPF